MTHYVCTISSQLISLIILISLLFNFVNSSDDNVITINNDARNYGDIQSLFHSSLLPAISTHDDEEQGVNSNGNKHQLCKNYTRLYLQELKRFTLWAAQMYDSTAKVPEGILSGNVYQFGNYDGCLKIDVNGEFSGKYCLAKVQFEPLVSAYPSYYSPSDDPYRMTFEANGSAWEKIKNTGDRRRLRRDLIHWGVCVPSVCDTRDIANALQAAVQRLEARIGLRGTVTLPEVMCSTRDSARKIDTADVSYASFLAVVILLVLICSALDSLATYKGKWKEDSSLGVGVKVVRAFSIRANWIGLGRGPASRDAEAGDLRCIHGLRFFSMLLIILGHRCMFTFGGPLSTSERVEEIYTTAANMLLLNGPIIVDTFFVISGFLSCYLMLLELDKKKKLNIPILYIYRYIRLTPVYAVVVAFYATFFDQLGDGPLWNSKVGLERERCRNNWWTNILYINNYINAKQMCMFQSWFLACDMHYFLLAPLLVMALWKWPRTGKIVLTLATVISIIVPFAVTLFAGLDAVLLLYMSTLADPVGNDTFRSIYIPSHTRAGPYFLGMLWGYVFYRMRINGTKVSKRSGAFLWAFLHLVALGSLFGAWAFYLPGIERSALERALYGGLHRAGWGVAMGWLIIACASGLSGPYRALLSWKPLVPFSRLTYCAFLAHAGVQIYQAATMRTAEYMSYYKLFWMTSGDVAVTFLCALVLYMLFEAPINTLEKIFIKKGEKADTGSNLQHNLPMTITTLESIKTGQPSLS